MHTHTHRREHARGHTHTHTFLHCAFAHLLTCRPLMPTQVGFYWHATMCDRMYTESMDIFIDCFFMLEVCLNFYTGVWYEGIYHDRYFSLLILVCIVSAHSVP
jgi:hypothetical protein